MRTSKQRDLILEIVNTNFSHITALEIYNIAKQELENISLGTVYRNLSQLCEKKLIKKIKCSDNTDRFDNVKNNHAHFICNKCGDIIDIFDDLLIKQDVIHSNIITDYDLVLKGICSKCQKKEE